jgi:hypothetical protein
MGRSEGDYSATDVTGGHREAAEHEAHHTRFRASGGMMPTPGVAMHVHSKPIVTALAATLFAIGCGESTPAEDSGATTDAATSSDPEGTTAADDSADDGLDDGEASTGAPVDPDAPTFYGDVLPVVIERCAGCHTPGGIGSFDLQDYATASDLAEVLAIVTASRTMPPYNVTADGSCHTFVDQRWLTEGELDLFAAWAEAGAPEGDPSTPQPEPPSPAALAGDDITEIDTPEGYVPAPDGSGTNGYDDYQCFLVDLGIEGAPRYLTGYDVVPGNPAVAHHLVAFLVDPAADSGLIGTNGDLMAQLDAGSPDRPGWDCYGAAGNGVLVEGTPVTWAPGGGAFNLPEGTGIRVDPGEALVVQMHYNLATGDDGSDSTRVRLSWADAVEREAINTGNDEFLAAGFSGAIEIPPGEPAFVYQWDMPIGDLHDDVAGWAADGHAIEILGLLPHMHQIGRRMQIDLVSGGAESCGIFVHRWDFDWQQSFMYETPPVVSASDSIRVTCEWDSTSRDVPTLPGLGSQNEMCAFGIYVAPAPRP